jgi:hypothetical protein
MGPADRSEPRGTCPDRETLLAFSQSSLDLPALDALADHLAACPDCASRLRQLDDSSPLVRAYRRPPRGVVTIDESGQARLESRALTEGRSDETPPPVRALSPFSPGPAGCEPLPPSRVGRYQIVGKLGEGGMGTVYRAHDPGLDRIVALKLLSCCGRRDAALRTRFARELAAAGRLDHPHIARALDCGESDGRLFLVMEYVEGLDLDRLIGAAGPLPVADACELARQAAVALHHVHGCGLVHRDVKPSNLMVTPDGRLKLLDLGLARFHGAAGPGEALTEFGQVLGTVDYLAPEQLSDPRRVDGRADLYALGCTLYHLLSGRAPFDGPGCRLPHEKLTAHGHAPPPALRARRPGVPEAVAVVVHRMLAKAPADRYATAAEVAAALAPHAAGCDLAGLVASASPRALTRAAGGTQGADDATGAQTTCLAPSPRAPAPRRRLALAGLVAGFAVVVAAAVIFGKWLWAAPTTPRDRPLDDLPPLVWHPLLDRPPAEVRWPHRGGESMWALNPYRHELWVSCHDDKGLLRVAEVRRTDYALRVEISQNGWTGGVGIFFGYAEDVFQGEPCVRYQVLELRPPSRHDAGTEFRLLRSIEYLVSRPEGGASEVKRQLASAPVRRPDRHDQLLDIEIEARGLVAVRWDGQALPSLTEPEVNGQLKGSDYLGSFGTMNSSATGVFRTYQLKLFERGGQ